jgi:serine/threonine protein kinase/Flp pilus assembly protein TadD
MTGFEPGSMPKAAGPLAVGQAFSTRYHIIRLLGAGGMGAVYQAWDAELGVSVALKVILLDRHSGSASSELEKRFKNELLLARQVTHKNVVRIHDLGEIDGIKYITMPYVQGDDLATLLRRETRLPIARALSFARQIAGGLEAAHDAGVVHRDLKPPNIMIGADDLALIMDFGISASTVEATAGGVIGTLEYMAPEHGSGKPTDARADIYAFGLMLYEMLTGPRPAPATTGQERIEAMKRRFEDGLPAVRTVDESIPEPLASVVTRCLEKDPAARYQTTAELSAALKTLDDRGELIPIPPRFSKRLIAASAMTVLSVVAATWFVTRTPPPPKAHDPVSVILADFENRTGDAAFDRTLEPMLKLRLEEAAFVSAYDRTGIRRSLGVRPPEQLDAQAAQQLAIKQGVGVVVTGALDRQGGGYGVSMKATQAVTGNVITTASARAANREQVLAVATGLADKVRKALGDNTADSAQRFAKYTLSATSVDAVHDYAAGMVAISNSKFEEARQSFSHAVERDPKFGMAWTALAMASYNLDKVQDTEKYVKEAFRHLETMSERERYRTRGLYYMATNDYQQCVKEYGDLTARYAGDASARNNLALCLSHLRKNSEAADQMRQVVEILPNRPLYRENLALYAAYGGDFQGAENEVRELRQPSWLGVLALAFAQLGQGQLPQATATYEQLGKIDAQGASYMASGLGDLALYQGRFSDAIKILEPAAAKDVAEKDLDRAASKFAALANARLLRHQHGAAIAAADAALANSKVAKVRFLAARVFVETGQTAKARTLAAALASELQAEPQAFAKIIEGIAALKNGDARQAIKPLTEANTLLDTWIGRFELGRAYLEAGAFAQADSEFDRCIKRRGEALAVFLDEEPTYGYLPPVYYYQGRVREELGTAGFAESYRAYLEIRGNSSEDSLLPEIRRRAGLNPEGNSVARAGSGAPLAR